MLVSQRVPLTKACSQCIKAKRKCSRGLPQCQRCAKQGLFACEYKNAPLTSTRGKSLVAEITVAVSPRAQSQDDRNPLGGRSSPSTSFYDPYTPEPLGSPRAVSTLELSSSSLSCIQLAPPDVVMTWDEPTMEYLTTHLKSFAGIFSRSGGTPFIHPELYQRGFPQQLRNIFTLCCAHAHANQDSHLIISQTIASAATTLISSISSAHTFMSLLELLQSLVLLQIITLLYTTTSQSLRKQAAHRMPLLASLTKKLFRSVPAYLPSSLSHYQAWILAESVRRTIHVAHLVQGVYSVMTRGHFILTAFVETLPLNQRSLIWDSGPPTTRNRDFVEPRTDNASLETDLISYREFVDKWDTGTVKRLGLFEEMLIVACKGATCVLQNVEKQID